MILSEDGTEALKLVGVHLKYFNIYVCAYFGMNNKRYRMHGMYAVGSKSFRPDIQKPRQMENAVRDI